MSQLDQLPFATPPIQIVDHYDQESAYIIYQFPYRAALNTQVRWWTETRESYGQRFVYQTLDPISMKWLAIKPSQYFDIVVLTVVSDQTHSKCGHVMPQTYTLSELPNSELFKLCLQYSFTNYQRKKLLMELNERGFLKAPPWKVTPSIRYAIADLKETPPLSKFMTRINEKRLRNEAGILIETFEEAEARLFKEKQSAQPTEPKTIPTEPTQPTQTTEPTQLNQPTQPTQTIQTTNKPFEFVSEGETFNAQQYAQALAVKHDFAIHPRAFDRYNQTLDPADLPEHALIDWNNPTNPFDE